MKNQKVSTTLGAIILVIIAATVAGFVLLLMKKYPVEDDITLLTIPEKKSKQTIFEKDPCTLVPEEVEELFEQIDIHNNTTADKTIYSNPKRGIQSIDLGKYGFTVNHEESVSFGKWSNGAPCPILLTQYFLRFVEERSKDEIIDDIKSREYEMEEKTDGLKLKGVEKMNNFDVVVWEEWGPYPTYQLTFEIPKKEGNIVIETHPMLGNKSDYQEIIKVLQTLIMKSE